MDTIYAVITTDIFQVPQNSCQPSYTSPNYDNYEYKTY